MSVNIVYDPQYEYDLGRHNYLNEHPDHVYVYRESLTISQKELPGSKVKELIHKTEMVGKTLYFAASNKHMKNWLFTATHDSHQGLVLMSQHDDSLGFSVDAKSDEAAGEIAKKLKSLFKDFAVAKDEDHVRVRFWYAAGSYNENYIRQIKCPTFKDIADNYPEETVKEIEWLLGTENPWEIGKIIFWMGLPGTGKTFATRAIIREWSKKMNPHVIVDPENFFANTGYLMQVLEESECEEDSSKTSNLIILEDSPRIVLTESRAASDTYSMSRFLNITDGILGQGISSVFLLTTNDEIDDIDPAFLRSGRLLQRMKFNPFQVEAANKWLEEHEYKGDVVDDTQILSELYGLLNNRVAHAPEIATPRAGFLP